DSAISWAVLVFVPLKNICSKKCEIPLFVSFSFLDPASTQIPMVTERTDGICSITIRSPFLHVCFLINECPPKRTSKYLSFFTEELFDTTDFIFLLFNLIAYWINSFGNCRCRLPSHSPASLTFT